VAASRTVRGRTHQQQLRRLRAQVEALRQQLRGAQRLAAVGTMTAMVAHEFNNILTPIIGYAHLARRNPSLTDKAIARAADGGRRASEICTAIMDLARGESASPRTVNLAALVNEVLTAMARAPGKDGIDLKVKIPEKLSVTARPVELQQVLLNLLLNARAAVLPNRPPRVIEVSARRSGQAVAFAVRDNGVGIPPENLRKIFQPFFTTRPDGDGKSKGHGLGLAICHEIISSMGGSISVRSLPGQGTAFTVRIPN